MATFGTLIAAEWGLVAVATAASWFACYRFLRVFRPATVWIGIGTLWGLVLLNMIGEPLIVAGITGIDVGFILSESAVEFIQPIAYSTVWTLYLLISKRVKNTYHSPQYRSDGAADVFS